VAGQAAGQAHDAGLGRGVLGWQQLGAGAAGDGADVDDGTAAPGPEVGQGGLGAQEGGLDVPGQDAVEALLVDVVDVDRGVGAAAGVVDQHGDVAEGGGGAVEGAGGALPAGDVLVDADDRHVFVGEVGHRAGEGVAVAVDQRHAGALSGEGAGDVAPDALGGAGHDHRGAGERQVGHGGDLLGRVERGRGRVRR
jgi:hypothetical protein